MKEFWEGLKEVYKDLKGFIVTPLLNLDKRSWGYITGMFLALILLGYLVFCFLKIFVSILILLCLVYFIFVYFLDIEELEDIDDAEEDK